MKTILLMWNPQISNFKPDDYDQIYNDEHPALSWSVCYYHKVEIGDRFYMVRVGQENTGIVMSDTIVSLPHQDEDWSGKSCQVFYADLRIELMTQSAKPIIQTDCLMENFPGFDWTRGHSGRVLPKEIALKLEEYWQTEILDSQG